MLEGILVISYFVIAVVAAGFWIDEYKGSSLLMGVYWPFFLLLAFGSWLRDTLKP